ncbi:hypothetical protein GCM10010317_080560 [Streptomyces mirabilis]|nr:hypothetical protein GCM10010317_080560 [Streptomyces mirabilis]
MQRRVGQHLGHFPGMFDTEGKEIETGGAQGVGGEVGWGHWVSLEGAPDAHGLGRTAARLAVRLRPGPLARTGPQSIRVSDGT